MFSYSEKERYMTDKEYLNLRRKYLHIFPTLLINLVLVISILLINDNIFKIELILLLSVFSLFIPLTLIPHLEKSFKLNDNIDKKSFLFILYIVDLSALMFSINWLINLPEQHKTILFAIIGGLYGAVIPRYLTATLEVIEKQFGIKK